jgi:hypothetical protein
MLIRVRGRKRDITAGYKMANKMRTMSNFILEKDV